MEGITLNTIPAWVVGVIMLYTGLIWLITRNSKIRMDSRTIAYTQLIWGAMYLGASFYTESSQAELLVRLFMSRIILILVCLSQSLPLTISYIRSIRRGNGLE